MAQQKIRAATVKINKRLMDIAGEAIKEPRNFLLDKLGEAKSGNFYQGPRFFNRVRSSAENEFPATQTGELERGLETFVKRKGRLIVGAFRSNVDYSIDLEFGHTHPDTGKAVEARPKGRGFMRGALMKSIPAMRDVFKKRTKRL